MYRLKRGMSQVALAETSGVAQSTISAIEHGVDPTWENMKRLANALHINQRDLMGAKEVAK